MNLKQTIAVSILAIAGLTSCEKNLYEPTQDENENLKLTDLPIPSNFDWKMIENGKCTITASQAAKVSVYSEESLNEKSLLATVGIKSGENITLPISLLKGAQNVYVQYENASGIKTVKTAVVEANGNISVTIPSSSTTRALTDDDFIKDGSATLYYPNKEFGTVMFEDSYPALGDYDFNDFVADYNILIETAPNNTNQINKITLVMQVKAIGANQSMHHYIPHLGLPIPKECIDKIEVTTRSPFNNKETDFVKAINVTDNSVKKNYMVLAFNGAELNSLKNQDSEYLNTEKGYKTVIKSFVVDITFKVHNELSADLEYIKADGFDIFLATADQSQEIHMNGFTPVFTLEDKTYKNEHNYVWGINMPSTTPQVYEKANFIKAYPDFKTWLTDPSYQWYLHSNKEFLFEE